MMHISFSVTERVFNPGRLWKCDSMIRKMIDRLCCPACKSALELKVTAENGEEILAGELFCAKCAAAYPIENGIPDMLPPELKKVSRK